MLSHSQPLLVNGLSYQLRMMQSDDLVSVMAIEQRAHSHPWQYAHMQSSLSSSHVCLVVVDAEYSVVAYCIISHVLDEAELLNITVTPEQHRCGLGQALLAAVIEYLDGRTRQLFLEVRVSNTAAIAFYDDFGFNEVGIRKNYYPGKQGREDALILAKDFMLSL